MAKKPEVVKTPTVISIPQVRIQRLTIKLIGDAPLVSHAWSEKAKQMMRDTQMKKAKRGKEAKDPWADFCGSLYWMTEKPENPTQADIDEAKFGMPAIGFKRAAVDACSHVDGVTKVEARGAFHINGEYVQIHGTPKMREDMVRVGMGSADLRYRGEFNPWTATFEVRYNENVLSAEQVINLFNTAGFALGIGEYRPQRNGSWGLFHVAGQGE